MMWLLKQPTHGTDLSIESLKLANDEISPRLAGAKVILQSILLSLSPRRSYKKKTATMAQQAVHVTMKFSSFIETRNEVPQLVKHCLEETLRDVQRFIQLETQSSILHRLVFRKTISARYVVLEERLRTTLVHFEQYIVDLQSTDSMHTFPLVNNGDVVGSGEIFSKIHDLTVNGGNYYSARKILIQQSSHQGSAKGIIPGIRVIAPEDISMSHELYINREYRLYSGNILGKARVIKVFRGPLAEETVKFHQKIMHPSFLHTVGVSPIDSEVPFLVFDGGLEGTLEASIVVALKKGVKNGLMLGLQTVIGISSGLGYLHDDAMYHFKSAGFKHFSLFLSLEGKVIISPLIDLGRIDEDCHEEQGTSSEVNKPLIIFHGLCKQTFDAACQTHYDGKSIERVYDDLDIWEDKDRFEDVNDNSIPENVDTSTSARNASPLIHQTNLASAASSIQESSNQSRKKLPNNGHRRELVWNSENAQDSSLYDICHRFKAFLDALSVSSGPELHRCRGRYTARTAHRCPGYNRTEIVLTPNITRSAIVSHSTPLPHEICPVCKQVVKDAEIFNCICGEEDNESVPTIRCSKCHKWHHRPCVVGFKSTDRCFTCPDCDDEDGNFVTIGEFNDAETDSLLDNTYERSGYEGDHSQYPQEESYQQSEYERNDLFGQQTLENLFKLGQRDSSSGRQSFEEEMSKLRQRDDSPDRQYLKEDLFKVRRRASIPGLSDGAWEVVKGNDYSVFKSIEVDGDSIQMHFDDGSEDGDEQFF